MAKPVDNAELDAAVLAVVTRYAGEQGLTATTIYGYFPSRSWTSTTQVGLSLRRLHARGAVKCWQPESKGRRWTLPGVTLDRSRYEPGVEIRETDAMAKALENLFALTPLDYSHGNIITLERGRVGLKPSIPIPGRAIGAW